MNSIGKDAHYALGSDSNLNSWHEARQWCQKAGAEFSFDYLLLVILAGIIAFMGLLENSSVVLVASMLVSPIMGEVNHATLVTQ